MSTQEAYKQTVMECTLASLNEMRADLERRLAIVLKAKGLPKEVVINMAQSVSKELEGFVTHELLASGRIEERVDKLL